MKLSQTDSRDNIALDLMVWVISMIGGGAYSLVLYHSSDGIPCWLSFMGNQIKN